MVSDLRLTDGRSVTAPPFQPAASAADGELRIASEPLHGYLFEGFGGCFNERGWEAMANFTAGEKRQVVGSLFDAEDGLGLRFGRVPIGASDYALDWYSANDRPDDFDHRYFNLDRDRVRLLPFLRTALAFRPDLELFGSPWSPPAWMKTNGRYNGGELIWDPLHRSSYARYLAKWVEAMRAEGLNVTGIHVQNEPDSDQPFPSCLWTGEKLRDFIKEDLAPLRDASRTPFQIWLGTIERADYTAWIGPTLADPVARAAIAGVGYQWAGKGAIQRTHEAFPDLPKVQTETECHDGQNSVDQMLLTFDLIRHYLGNGARRYYFWNMILPPGGESTWGWKQNALITVDPLGKVTQNPEYHLLSVLKGVAGSTLLRTSGAWAAHSLVFQLGGQRRVVMANPYPEAKVVTLPDLPAPATLSLPPKSVVAFTA